MPESVWNEDSEAESAENRRELLILFRSPDGGHEQPMPSVAE
jgi:hypothetical protein